MIINVNDYLDSLGVLMHYGTPRHSGRYPWGSGENGQNKGFLQHVNDLKKQGISEVDIAHGMGMTVTQLRNAKSIAKNAQKAADISMAERLKAKGYSNQAIAERMSLSGESSVRALLAEGVKDKVDVLQTTAGMLKEKVDAGAYLDVGTGVEYQLGVSRVKLDTAVALLKEQGYSFQKVQVQQLGTKNKTTIKVLCPPGTEYKDIVTNMENIRQVQAYSEDGGHSYSLIQPPLSISSKRVAVRYAEEGGVNADGVIFVRPGVDDISIGAKNHAQVRIMVDDTHYLKGMAIYKDDLPDGVDLMFNTNKSNTGNKLDALKGIKDDPENPFGAIVRQQIDPKTGKVTSVMNLVNEEGDWSNWSRNLPAQFLSKQSPALAKQQLDVSYERKRDELDDILQLTNPAVRKTLLDSYADSADSSAVHLKAAALPRQATHVILPVESMKSTEIYAPNYNNGDRVALVRFPHGGTFEIPELTVNNNHSAARKLLGMTEDAVGINSKVAERLSGADFDGDTVLVIPNNSGRVKSTPALKKLEKFDAKREYAPYDGMHTMDGGTYNASTKKVEFAPGKKPSSRTKGFEMGDVSNLITDMTIKGASPDELAHAVKHSMVVIDAEKHSLNWKQSAIDNNIRLLKEKYQARPDGRAGGASTLISRATARKDIRARKQSYKVDPETGKKIYTETGEHWTDPKTGKVKYAMQRSQKLAETDDAHTLVSGNGGTKIEKIYADHSNRMKSLANEARLASVHTRSTPYSPSAKKAFAPEVKALNDKLALAVQNRPRERQAQLFANTVVKAKQKDNPDMDADALKKLKFQALEAARLRTQAKKAQIHITDAEWSAIQAGAISNAKLVDILKNADLERVKQLATPKREVLMTSVKTRRAESMAKLGYTQAEIASALGVSVTTLKRGLNGE